MYLAALEGVFVRSTKTRRTVCLSAFCLFSRVSQGSQRETRERILDVFEVFFVGFFQTRCLWNPWSAPRIPVVFVISVVSGGLGHWHRGSPSRNWNGTAEQLALGNEKAARSFSARSFFCASLGLWTSTRSGYGRPHPDACFSKVAIVCPKFSPPGTSARMTPGHPRDIRPKNLLFVLVVGFSEIPWSCISKPMVCQTYGLHAGGFSRKRRKSRERRESRKRRKSRKRQRQLRHAACVRSETFAQR